MSDFDTAVERLTAWLRDYGPTKNKPFVDDITIVLLAARDSVRQAAEIEQLQLENNKLHTECGHLQADLSVARKFIGELTEQLQQCQHYQDAAGGAT